LTTPEATFQNHDEGLDAAMRFSQRSWARRLATLLASLLLSGCVSAVSVSIENRSPAQLADVVVSGSGFSEAIGSIAAGGTATVRVRPPGASQIKVTFAVEGQRYSATSSEKIINDGSAVGVVVDADFSIVINTNAR
jgi:hypothetical protein